MSIIRSPFAHAFLLGTSICLLSACAVAPGYTEQEQTIVDNLQPGLYQPASRQDRDAIETQDLLAQATFWSREAQLNPADLETAIKLTAAVRKMGNAAKAVDIAQTARAMHPSNPYLLAEYAASLIADERGEDAVKPLQQGLRSTPAYARLWSLMGASLDQQEKYPQARKHYERALKITPNDANVLANMGLSFALEGNAAVAEHWLRRAAAQPGASKGVSQNLALVLQLQGKAPEGQLAERQAPTASQHAASQYQRQRPQQGAPNARTSAPTQSYRNAGRSAPRSQGYSQQGSSQQGYAQQGYPQQQPAYQQQQSQQGQMANGQSFSFGIGEPKSASEAARRAARSSQSRKVTVPDGQPIPGQLYGAPRQHANPPQGQQIQGQQIQWRAQTQQAPNGAYAAPQYNGPPQQQYQQPYQPQPRPRGAARRR